MSALKQQMMKLGKMMKVLLPLKTQAAKPQKGWADEVFSETHPPAKRKAPLTDEVSPW